MINSWLWAHVINCLEKILLSQYWLDNLSRFESIKVAYSGGLDSTVLLHQLANIPNIVDKVLAVHVNHGLSSFANEWQEHCENYCKSINIPIIISKVQISGCSNIEEQARNARYAVFESLLLDNECIVLAHHCNDQAETLLLNLLRGTGVDGLAAMSKTRSLGHGEIIRPFLSLTRNDLEKYAEQHKLVWVNDDSNNSLNFSRNYLRHKILPAIYERWPNAIKNIAACADKCHNARENLASLAEVDGLLIKDSKETLSLKSMPLDNKSRLINILRAWFKKNSIKSPSAKIFDKLISDVIFACVDSNPYFTWNNIVIRRYRDTLYLLPKINIKYKDSTWINFPNTYTIENGVYLTASIGDVGLSIAKKSLVEIRFRKGGESLQKNGQTKKLKTIFQELGIPPWQRDRIPLIYIDGSLKSVVGYLIADNDLDTEEKYNIELLFNRE